MSMSHSTDPRPDGRTARYADVAAEIRDRIVSGLLVPGCRLPTREALAREFGTTRVTVQRAFDRLLRDGFVVPRGRAGTYVADDPPHLSCYAAVFLDRVSLERPFSLFSRALEDAARSLTESGAATIRRYRLQSQHIERGEYKALLADVRFRRLAGLIFAFPPAMFLDPDDPVLCQPGLGRVAIQSGSPTGDCAAVYPDLDSFVDRAAEFLAGRGRRNVAYVTIAGWRDQKDAEIVAAIRAWGLATHPFWLQHAHPSFPTSARNMVHLLMRGTPAEGRPDGLIVGDDHLTEHVAAGLMDAGIRVGKDLDVVALCNFPRPVPTALPFTRLGFDARQVIEACLDVLRTMRDGGAVPAPVHLPALFENELPAAGQEVPAAAPAGPGPEARTII